MFYTNEEMINALLIPENYFNRNNGLYSIIINDWNYNGWLINGNNDCVLILDCLDQDIILSLVNSLIKNETSFNYTKLTKSYYDSILKLSKHAISRSKINILGNEINIIVQEVDKD